MAATYAFVTPWQVAILPPVGIADYCTLAELKRSLYATIPSADDSLDDVLDTVIADASRIVDDLCNLPHGSFVARTLTKTFDVSTDPGATTYRNAWGDAYSASYVGVPPLLEVSSLATDEDGDREYETVWATTDYHLDPSDGPPYRRIVLDTAQGTHGWPTGQRRVRVTGSWGVSETVPAPIRRATILIATRLWKRAEAPFGIVGSVEVGASQIKAWDPDVMLILKEGGYVSDYSWWVLV